MGATLYFLGQLFPATITQVIESEREVTSIYIQEDAVLNAKTGGARGPTDYEFAPQPDYGEELFELDGQGRFVSEYGEVIVGERHYFALQIPEGYYRDSEQT